MAMSERGLVDLIKSHISRHKVLVRFINLCPVTVSARWINFGGEEVEYKKVEPGARYDVATYGSHPWVFRCSDNNLLMGVQLHNTRATTFEAYTFIREKQQVGLLNREQVVQALSGRNVLSVKIVSPFYTIHTLRHISLQAIATLVDHSEASLVSLGLPITLLDILKGMLEQQ